MDREDKLFIKDLTVKTKKGYLCVKVVRKWNYDGNVPGGSVIYIGLILADEQGASIYAQIPEAELGRLGSELMLDGIYTIRKFYVRVCKPNYVPLDAELMIQMTSFTTIFPSKVPVTTFPKYVYKITPFSEIKTTGETANRYIDVIGIVIDEGPTRTACPKGKDYVSTLKEIVIKNLSGGELTVTLWENHVHQFQLPNSSAAEGPQSVVALFCGCLAKRIFNKVQVNAGNACRWFLNPDIPEAQPLYDSLQHRPVPVRRAATVASVTAPTVKPNVLEHKALAHLNAMDPYDFPDEGYKCTAKIIEIPADQEWWYMGCQVCKKQLWNYGGSYYCAKCKCNTAVPLYKLSFIAADETDNARFFCYDVVARQIVRRNCDSLIRSIGDAPGLPEQIIRAIGRTFTFSVSLTEQSFSSMNSRVYSIDSCTFRPDPQIPPAINPASSQLPSSSTAHQSEGSQSVPLLPASSSDHAKGSVSDESKTMRHSDVMDMQSHTIHSTCSAQTPPPQLNAEETPTKETTNIPQLPRDNVRKRLADHMEAHAEDSSTKDTKATAPQKKKVAVASGNANVSSKGSSAEKSSKNDDTAI